MSPKKQGKTKPAGREEATAARGRIVTINEREFEIIGEARIGARVFEALAARSQLILAAMDQARLSRLQDGEFHPGPPAYKHTIFLGSDAAGKMMRASISAFDKQVVVQTLREV